MTPSESRRRQEQSQRDRQIEQARKGRMRKNAQIRSIPRRQETKVSTKQLLPQALRSMQFAPRGHGYYDAYSNTVDTAMLSVSVGPCTVIEGFGRTTVVGWGPLGAPGTPLDVNSPAGTTDNSCMLMFNPGRGANSVLRAFRKKADGSGLETDDLIIPQFPGSGESDESIPIRGSMQITNVSESLTRGGTVRFLRYNSGLEAPDDVATYDELADMIRGSARTQTMSGAQLTSTFQSNTYPADFSRSVEFASQAFVSGLRAPAYSTVLVLVDAFFPSSNGFNNTYEVTCKVQRAYRFLPGTTLHTLAREVPVVPAEAHTRHVHKESSGSQAKPSMLDAMKGFGMNAMAPVAGALAGKAGRELGTRLLPKLGKLAPYLAELPLLAL